MRKTRQRKEDERSQQVEAHGQSLSPAADLRKRFSARLYTAHSARLAGKRAMADNFAQTVKAQTDIVKIVGDYLKLRKSGAQNYQGLCPFHKEKSPSFSVNAVHQYYYCFGCHEKGDVFTFVMKMDSVSFPEAVRAVAGKAGIALPKRDFSNPEEAREAGIRKHLLDLHEAATQYFEANLKSPAAAAAREVSDRSRDRAGDRGEVPHRLRAG